jgi:hypothetical protein
MTMKLLAFLVMALCLTGLAFAAGTGGNDEMTDKSPKADDASANSGGQLPPPPPEPPTIPGVSQAQQSAETQTRQGEGVQTQTQQGYAQYNGLNGEKLELKTQGSVQLRVNGVEAHSGLEIRSENGQNNRTTLRTTLSNGKNAEIKVMPDVASERAMEQLQLKVCTSENGCTIELKEVGKGEEVKAAYEVRAEKEGKALGLFKTRVKVKAQIDAENGEVLKTSKPWWATVPKTADE